MAAVCGSYACILARLTPSLSCSGECSVTVSCLLPSCMMYSVVWNAYLTEWLNVSLSASASGNHMCFCRTLRLPLHSSLQIHSGAHFQSTGECLSGCQQLTMYSGRAGNGVMTAPIPGVWCSDWEPVLTICGLQCSCLTQQLETTTLQPG